MTDAPEYRVIRIQYDDGPRKTPPAPGSADPNVPHQHATHTGPGIPSVIYTPDGPYYLKPDQPDRADVYHYTIERQNENG